MTDKQRVDLLYLLFLFLQPKKKKEKKKREKKKEKKRKQKNDNTLFFSFFCSQARIASRARLSEHVMQTHTRPDLFILIVIKPVHLPHFGG
jgi:hypothetical protein